MTAPEMIDTFGFNLNGQKLIFSSESERDGSAAEFERDGGKPRFFGGRMLKSTFENLPEFEGFTRF